MNDIRVKKTIFILSATLFILFVNISCGGASEQVQNQQTPEMVLLPTPTLKSISQPTVTGDQADNGSGWLMHYREALRLWGDNQPNEAILEMKKVIDSGHDDKEIYRRLSEWFSALKRYPEEELYLQKIIEKDPMDARAHWALASLYIEKLDRFEDGIREGEITKGFYRRGTVLCSR